jgi:hypothetical protein
MGMYTKSYRTSQFSVACWQSCFLLLVSILRLGNRSSWLRRFRVSPQSLQSNAGIIAWIRPRPLPSGSVSIHYLRSSSRYSWESVVKWISDLNKSQWQWLKQEPVDWLNQNIRPNTYFPPVLLWFSLSIDRSQTTIEPFNCLKWSAKQLKTG